MRRRNTKSTSWKWTFPATFMMLLLLVTAMIAAQRTAAHAKSAPRYTMRGHIAPVLKQYKPMHAADSHQSMHLAVSLRLRNEAQLDALIAAQNDPHSSLYHRYITPEYFTEHFAPDEQTIERVSDYLRANGLSIDNVSSNHQLISMSGSMENAEKAFAVSISDYQIDGQVVYAPTDEPSVPAELGDVILHVSGLDSIAHYRHFAQFAPRASAVPGSGPVGGYTPTELRAAYNVNPLLNAGYNGKGQTVALFELDGYTPSNVNTYLQHYNLGSTKYSNVLIDGARNTAGSGALEVELDMEVLSAIAPQATQKVYIGPNTANGALDIYNRIVSDNSAKVVSISWGQCERDTGTALVDAMDNVFKQGVAQGQAFFAASGDSGAYGCDDKQLNVDYPAGDPHVVGVGGTKLSINSDNTYASESAWSSPSGQRIGGGGGGISQHFSRPAYQDGVQSNAKRTVPDVSADADINSGYSLYIQGHWDIVGGTSAAAPLWAGIATNVNQYLQAHNKPTLGSGHEALYSLYKNQQKYAPYHDVTTGNNLYYHAKQGYDMATGMGTPNAWNIARDLAAKSGSTTSGGSTGTTTGGDTSGSGSTNTGGNTGGDTSGSGSTNTSGSTNGGNTGSPGYPGGGYPYPGGNNSYPGGGYPYPGDNSGYPSYGPNW